MLYLSLLLSCGTADSAELTALQADLTASQDQLAALDARIEALEAQLSDQETGSALAQDNAARLDAVEFSAANSQARLDSYDDDLVGAAELLSVVEVDGSTVIFDGVNLQLRSGAGRTDSANGLGNLIIGYAADATGNDSRTGSHTLVIGDEHDWTSYAGIVAGWGNRLSAPYGSILGGLDNEVTGTRAVIVGGIGQLASGEESTILGGNANQATGTRASVLGGALNVASGQEATVGGGDANQASGTWSVVSGGRTGMASGGASVVVGGQSNQASTTDAVAVGGLENDAAGVQSVLVGGQGLTTTETGSVVP